MFRYILLTIYILMFSSIAFAQSGRVKPSETPAPNPKPRVVYLPTQNKSENYATECFADTADQIGR